jgi:hypothetical protein
VEANLQIVGAHHFLADLTLPFGRVVHDYNKQTEPFTATDLAADRSCWKASSFTTSNCNIDAIESSRASGERCFARIATLAWVGRNDQGLAMEGDDVSHRY